jgi:hypothetical protein
MYTGSMWIYIRGLGFITVMFFYKKRIFYLECDEQLSWFIENYFNSWKPEEIV